MADALRVFLAGLPEANIPTPPGQVAILRSTAIQAGADMDALDAWVSEHGGRVRTTPPVQSSGLRAGRVRARTEPGEAYYLLPRSALTDQTD